MKSLLAVIADLYTPVLIASLLVGVGAIANAQRPLLIGVLKSLLVLLIWVYGLMILDTVLMIWPRWSLDYSTHTALALALIWALVKVRKAHKKYSIASMVLYGQIMVVMNYHTWQDIITTALAMTVAILFVEWRWFYRRCQIP
ncbi:MULTISPECIES: hypothetical protein [unclassified Vibrio]|uniref:Uncharacterized protein n=1 Tax=Vibrio sp. HB236076 TaxID=3232307 RepID=A0AB39H7Y4_9VIBR|nr:hypothetical protein [Vibrio sp. HB161653]MDP5253568.1 hypothetical protein [Vibrio sp. HB161653]